jgi:hypothetical protein
MQVHPFIALKLYSFLHQHCTPRSKRMAGGYPTHVPKWHGTVPLNPAISALTASHALALSLKAVSDQAGNGKPHALRVPVPNYFGIAVCRFQPAIIRKPFKMWYLN